VPLRDGVYLAPATPQVHRALEDQRAEVAAAGGSAYMLPLSALKPVEEQAFIDLFDRSEEYAALERAVDDLVAALAERTEPEARRMLRQLKRDFAAVEAIDFFPAAAREEAGVRLREAEAALTRTFSPEEPAAIRAQITLRDRTRYRGRTWATRERLWVDRVASAWLIRRFIDPDARFVWLRRPAECPDLAVGFDFDGAEFTHVDERVTFAVLVESFALAEELALVRLGTLVRALDVGGERVPEAAGFEAVLTGARERYAADDDGLLEHVSLVLDDLYLAFTQPRPVPAETP